jgi:hypothetical protein
LLLEGDLNAKHPFWNSVVSNTSVAKLLDSLHLSDFEISAPQWPIHYSPAGNGDVLDIFMHKNAQLSEVIVSDILDLDHLPVVFHILDLIRIRNLSDLIDKLTGL